MKKTLLPILLTCTIAAASGQESAPIDREALVKRHNPVLTEANIRSPLTVGNGSIAFTADVTGLQTFVAPYEDGMPLNTMAYWGWHSFPAPEEYTLDDATVFEDHYGRQVPYAAMRGNAASYWLRGNPHRINLGRIGFHFGEDAVALDDISDIEQTLDLWTGVLTSRFRVLDETVTVETAMHGGEDTLGVRVSSPLLESGRLAVVVEFPYPARTEGLHQSAWDKPDLHDTRLRKETPRQALFERTLDGDRYTLRLAWTGDATLEETAKHRFVLTPAGYGTFAFSAGFAPQASRTPLPDADAILASSAQHWRGYWTEGGMVELAGSADPRAAELERRIVLSQYQLKVNSAAPMIPQESGLVCNSWAGNAHLEMHWWHGVHWALWGRLELLEQTLPWYESIMHHGRAMAQSQGYDGVRWPKMVGPDGMEGPSDIAVYLIWQQPHPIYYAELCYREHQNRRTLEAYKDIVFETAAFMASYAHWDAAAERYILGPPVIPAQERHRAQECFNPTYELEYWSFGLKVAQQWRERLGMPRNEAWDHVIEHLSPLPMKDGLYRTAESAMDEFGPVIDHPSLLAAKGVLPGPDVDADAMRRTLRKVFDVWEWEHTWGWDYPMVAMTAARVGEPELALKALLMDTPKNEYLPNGHNYQRPNLPLYLPGNGGLLTAVAMMAAGWDGAPDRPAPGFPDDGTWQVRWEGLRPMP